jgi:hypothetical protein
MKKVSNEIISSNKTDEFIKILESKKYNYYIRDGNIIINHDGPVDLSSLRYIPENVYFHNVGYIDLRLLEIIPTNTRFYIDEQLNIYSVESIGENVVFDIAKGDLICTNKSISPEDMRFNKYHKLIHNKLISINCGEKL